MTIVTIPRATVALAGALPISPEWYRWAHDITQRVGGPTGTGSNDLALSQFEDAGIEEVKARLSQIHDELRMLPLPAEAPAAAPLAQVAATIGPVPYGTQYAEVTVLDSNIAAASKVIVGWGNVSDSDENTPDFDEVRFNAVPAVGSMKVRLSCADQLHRLGGTYKINYLIG